MLRSVKETFGGKTQALNICVLGALAAITGAVRLDSIEKVLESRFAAVHHENNKKALHLGAGLAGEVRR